MLRIYLVTLLFLTIISAWSLPFSAAFANTFTGVVENAMTIDFSSPPSMFEATVKSHGADLPVIIYKANGHGPHPTIILLHGFPGNEKNLDLAQAYRRQGFNVIFFHYRGAWGAGGDYGISNQLADTQTIIEQIRAKTFPQSELIDSDKISLVGHSLGGFNALYSGMHNNTACTLAIAPTDLGGAVKNLTDIKTIVSDPYLGQPLLPLKGYSFADAVKETKDSLNRYHLLPQMGKFKRQPLLIVQGKQDIFKVADLTLISPSASKNLVDMATNLGATKASYIEMEGDHVFSWNRIALTDKTSHWLEKHCK
jgi:S-formylglutathione hydrolase FrmB